MKSYKTNYDFDKAKSEYRQFCEDKTHKIQLFAQPWYLDAVCANPDDWRVIIYKSNNKIIATFPFSYTKNKSGWWEINNPWQAKRLGLWVDFTGIQTSHKREALENEVVQYIIDNLPPYDVFKIDFDSRFTNWRVFYNNGFSQQTFYSYVVKKEQLESDYLSTIAKNRKKDIKTLSSTLDIESEKDFNVFWAFFEESYRLRGRTLSYKKQQIEQLINAAIAHNSAKLYIARSKGDGNILGVTAILYDSRRSYDMFCTFDPREKISPRILLTYQSLLEMTEKGLDYDFEGSMIPGVAHYYFQFNPELEPYFCITKMSDRAKMKLYFLQLLSLLRKKIFGGNEQKR